MDASQLAVIRVDPSKTRRLCVCTLHTPEGKHGQSVRWGAGKARTCSHRPVRVSSSIVSVRSFSECIARRVFCKGLTPEGIWVEDDDETGADPGKWWRDQWFEAQNLEALEVLANMHGVPGVDVDAQTPPQRWKPVGLRDEEYERLRVHGRTAVSLAAERGDTDAVRLLVRLGCDSQLTDAEGYAPAHYAAREGHARSLAALLEGGAEKAGINARDPAFGSTPLILACGEGHLEAAEVLLAGGADVFVIDGGNATAAGWCYQRRDGEMLALLLGAAGPTGCRKAKRGDSRYRIKQKELRSQLGILNEEQLTRVGVAWKSRGPCSTVEDLMKIANKQ